MTKRYTLQLVENMSCDALPYMKEDLKGYWVEYAQAKRIIDGLLKELEIERDLRREQRLQFLDND